MSDTIEVTNWTNYFKHFSEKNATRPVRLEIFGELGALEEVNLMPLAGIYVELMGENAPRVGIMLGGMSAEQTSHFTHTVPNVATIMTQTGNDLQEKAIVFVSKDGSRTLISFLTAVEPRPASAASMKKRYCSKAATARSKFPSVSTKRSK
jgi:hypothetical protein